jgi:hypothetical protein
VVETSQTHGRNAQGSQLSDVVTWSWMIRPNRSPATKAKSKADGAVSMTPTKSATAAAAATALSSVAVPVSHPVRTGGGVIESPVETSHKKKKKTTTQQTDSATLADSFLRELQPFTPPPPAARPATAAAAAADPSPLSTASHALMTTATAATATAAAVADGAHGGSVADLGVWSSDTVLGVVASLVAKLPADKQQAALAAATQELQAGAKTAKPVARTNKGKVGSLSLSHQSSPQPTANSLSHPRLGNNHPTPTTTVSRAATAASDAAAAAAGLRAATLTEPSVMRLAAHAEPPAPLPSMPPLLAASPLSPALAAELKQMRLMQFRLQLRESVLCRQV